MLLIKIGGGKQINWNYIAEDIAELICNGEKVIIVHGASATRDEVAEKLGFPTKTIISPSGIPSVYTDQKAVEVLLMVYCGLVNKTVVSILQRRGVNAVGLSGIDGKLWQAKRKEFVYAQENGKTKLIKNNFTGRVEKINKDLIKILIENKYVPIICAPAISFENEIVNMDNDWAAAVMAGALNIKKIVVLFEAQGLLKNIHDPTGFIKNIKKENLDEYLKFAQGRMKKKILGAKEAFELGVEKIFWGDGRVKNPINRVMNGQGTIIQ